MKLTKSLLVILLMALTASAQQRGVYFADKSGISLEARINEAFRKANDAIRGSKNFWLGYTIEQYQGGDSYYSDRYSRIEETLEQLIYNKGYDIWKDERESLKRAAERALKDLADDKDKKMLKRYYNYYDEIAVMLLYDSMDKKRPAKIKILNLRQPFDRYDYPVFWLGRADDRESISFLEGIYDYAQYRDTKEKLTTAIGIHESKDIVFTALKKIIDTENSEKILKNAIFWVGNIRTMKAALYLNSLRDRIRSTEIMESIIFALHNSDTEYADKILIDIAKSKRERSEVRKKAIFWLSQRASKIAFDTLEEIVMDSDERKLQEHTVFAISQFPTDEAIPALIRIAKNNPSKSVRKKAIFWLSQKDDPRVIKFLENILLNR